MLAAEAVDTNSCREAAIVGGIVRTVIATGQIHPAWVAKYTSDIIHHFKILNVDARPPGLLEMEPVVQRFQQSYRQPFG